MLVRVVASSVRRTWEISSCSEAASVVAYPFFHAFFVFAVSGESPGYSLSSYSTFPFGEEA